MALTASMAPAVALAAGTEADAQGTVVVAEADAGEAAQTASHTASVTDITDTSVKITVNESLGDFDPTASGAYVIKAYLIEKAGETAPDNGEDLYDEATTGEGFVGYAVSTGSLSYATPDDWTTTGLEAGTDYVVYSTVLYPAKDENGKYSSDSERLSTPIVATSFTTLSATLVTDEISVLVSGDFDADAVAAARADYNALSEEQQAQVSNTGVLTAAEAVVSARAEAAAAQAEAEQAKVDAQDAADKQAAAEAAATEAQQKQAEAEQAAATARQKQAAAEAALAKYQKASSKKANTITAKAAKKTVSYKALKKKAKKVAIKVSNAKGAVTFAKAKKTGKYKKVSVSSKGKVTFKKGAKKGTYSFKVKAAGNASYKAKTVTVKIKVK